MFQTTNQTYTWGMRGHQGSQGSQPSASAASSRGGLKRLGAAERIPPAHLKPKIAHITGGSHIQLDICIIFIHVLS